MYNNFVRDWKDYRLETSQEVFFNPYKTKNHKHLACGFSYSLLFYAIVIYISKLRAKVDAYNRNVEIKNFKKHQNADSYVNEKAIIGSKKAKYFKQINKSKYILDVEKIEYDKQFDGIYVYEISLINTEANEITSMYLEQWRI
ncbi:hypothetical protein RNN91_04720 [Mycoplasmopsis felis]|uniref:hypothetical protein n=1 Tax=Mycoplasmopsis felis TaxID=33923 RepID=UPI002AF6C284|nr:hypothetical protein [Mycoplasmopsis felis]WQQ01740.1 hypothetical protein RRG54_04130 [Mycoplasmopsis felis]